MIIRRMNNTELLDMFLVSTNGEVINNRAEEAFMESVMTDIPEELSRCGLQSGIFINYFSLSVIYKNKL